MSVVSAMILTSANLTGAPSCGFGEVECMYYDNSFLFVSYDYSEVLTGDGCIVTF